MNRPKNRRMICLAAVLFVCGCSEKRTVEQKSEPPPDARKTPPRKGPDIRKAIRRGVEAICKIPEQNLRHDTATGLSHVRRVIWWKDLDGCFDRIKKRAFKDHDNPLNVLIDPSYRGPISIDSILKSRLPKPGEKRINVNRILSRAAHCKKNTFTDPAFAYTTGPMRDSGGFHSTHAIWALIILKERGCRTGPKLDKAILDLRKELSDAQKKGLDPKTTRNIDLYAERIMCLAMSGESPESLAPFVEKLMATQRKDGLFATPTEKQKHWLLHCTTVSVWALAEFLKARGRRPGRE